MLSGMAASPRIQASSSVVGTRSRTARSSSPRRSAAFRSSRRFALSAMVPESYGLPSPTAMRGFTYVIRCCGGCGTAVCCSADTHRRRPVRVVFQCPHGADASRWPAARESGRCRRHNKERRKRPAGMPTMRRGSCGRGNATTVSLRSPPRLTTSGWGNAPNSGAARASLATKGASGAVALALCPICSMPICSYLPNSLAAYAFLGRIMFVA